MSSSDINKICKDGSSTKSSNDDVCDVNNKLKNMSTADLLCANCGKEGANNTCNKCKMVKYCNAACKKKHRHKHKKDCEEHLKLVAEHAAELHDEKLFKQPPSQYGDCPICFLRMPSLHTGSQYNSCCGKVICSGCCYAPVYDDQGNEVDNQKCAFCRTPSPTSDKGMVERYKKRVEAGDAEAMYSLGYYYSEGIYGYPQDYNKALEFYHRAADLGYTGAYNNIGYAYNNGKGVEVDENRGTFYWELSAMGGDATARGNLGEMEEKAGNMGRALKHYVIAVGSGHNPSLEHIKDLYSKGHVTKEDYTKALRLYQEYLGEIKSVQRDKAAAADEENRYY